MKRLYLNHMARTVGTTSFLSLVTFCCSADVIPSAIVNTWTCAPLHTKYNKQCTVTFSKNGISKDSCYANSPWNYEVYNGDIYGIDTRWKSRSTKPSYKILRLDEEGLIIEGSVNYKCIAKGKTGKSPVSKSGAPIYGDPQLPPTAYQEMNYVPLNLAVVYSTFADSYLSKQSIDEQVAVVFPEYKNINDAFRKAELKQSFLQKIQSAKEKAKSNQYLKFMPFVLGNQGQPLLESLVQLQGAIDIDSMTYKVATPGAPESSPYACLDRYRYIGSDHGIKFNNLTMRDICTIKVADVNVAKEIERVRAMPFRLHVAPTIYGYALPQDNHGDALINILHVEYAFYEGENQYDKNLRLIAVLRSHD